VTLDPQRDKLSARIPVFRGLHPGEYHQLMEIAREKTFEPGKKIIEQGKTCQSLWIVLEGACQVVRDTPRNGPAVLADLQPYDLFGEMSFFSPAPHSANVVAKSRVKLLAIARADYDDLIRDGVTAAYKLAYNVVARVAKRLRTMDERVAAMAAHSDQEGADKRPDWHQFRENLFGEWNL
jgi:CRP-like cAMP-binding protein